MWASSWATTPRTSSRLEDVEEPPGHAHDGVALVAAGRERVGLDVG